MPPQVAPDSVRRAGVPINYPIFEETHHFMVKIQPFQSGGYEATCQLVDLQKIADRGQNPPRRHVVRRQHEDRSPDDIERSRRRAKRDLRHKVKNMGASHLLTLTTREQKNSPEDLWPRWKAFVRSYRKATGEDLCYVAVPEPHPTNPDHWHLHVAVAGRININIARQLWWARCGGRGTGNVDAKYIRVPFNRSRTDRVARYISKYVSKALVDRFNKRRFAASKQALPESRRFWMKTREFGSDLFLELGERLGVRIWEFWKDGRQDFFIFPNQQGLWINFTPGVHEPDAPPF